MRTAILSIGDELVLGQGTDTNSATISAALEAEGVAVEEHRTVGDDRARIVRTMRELADGRDLLLVTGGLGPTADDLTRHALGDLVDPGAALVEDPEARRELERWFAGRGGMPEANAIQARRPPSARLLSNPNGTAPGLEATHAGCRIVVMPGPPREMRPMLERVVLAPLRAGGAVSADRLATRTVHAWGLGESAAAERLGTLMSRDRNPLVGTTASGGVVTGRVRAWGEGAADRADEAADAVAAAWTPYVFGRDGTTLPESIGAALAREGLRLATAESCTGGLLGGLVTEVPGSSAWYVGGWVTYTNEMKHEHLGVPTDVLARVGAVSREVVLAMADGARVRSGADAALSISGVAGPGGGHGARPVGHVWIGLALARPADAAPALAARCFRFKGDRATVRRRSAMSALQMLGLALARGVSDADPPLLWQHRLDAEARG